MTNPLPNPISTPIPTTNIQLPRTDRSAYQRHCRQFCDEYQPATPTETQLTQELADTAWRLNRIPSLEAALLDRAANPPTEQAAISFDIVDAHRALATLSLHSQRLSRQFQRTLSTLREIQSERAERERRDLKDAAALLELHKHKGIPFAPAQYGFVFSKDQVEEFSQRLIRLNQSRHIEYVLFHMPPPPLSQPRPQISGKIQGVDQITSLDTYIDWTGCELVERVPGKVSGRPVVRGTRIMPDAIVGSYDLGETIEELHQGFPTLSVAQIKRLIEFAHAQREQQHRL